MEKKSFREVRREKRRKEKEYKEVRFLMPLGTKGKAIATDKQRRQR